MTKEEIIKELREILKVYHYESEEQHISKDVVTSLENIIIGLKNDR
jgi:predicted oxidoreductase